MRRLSISCFLLGYGPSFDTLFDTGFSASQNLRQSRTCRLIRWITDEIVGYPLVRRIVIHGFRRRFGMCSLIALNFVLITRSQVCGDYMDAWDGSPFEYLWPSRSRPSLVGYEPEWQFKDPTFLYLTFETKSEPNARMTILFHPTKRKSAAYEEGFSLGHQQNAQAFGIRLDSQSPEGYEVSFQAIDPITGQPLPLRCRIVLFSRSTRTTVPLTDRISVSGFYGDPRFR